MDCKEKFLNQYEIVPNKDEVIQGETKETPPYGFGVRHIQVLIFFISITTAYLAKVHLGVTIVAMVDQQVGENALQNTPCLSLTEPNSTKYYKESAPKTETNGFTSDYHIKLAMFNCSNVFNDASNTWKVFETFKWPKSTQEMVLGSFFFGYFVMTFPLSLVSQRWGGKLPLQIGLFVNGFLSIVAPWLAMWGGWKVLCACRVVQGLAHAGLYPGAVTLLANWVPPSERGRFSAFVFTGSIVGTFLSFQLGGILAHIWGWPAVFWSVGGLCILIGILVTVFLEATPSLHKYISEAERKFILEKAHVGPVTKRRLPWLAILTSKHVWAIFVAHSGSEIPLVFLYTQVPSYLHYILKLDVKKSGLLSSLPYIGNFIFTVAVSSFWELCTNKKLLSVKYSRILSNSIATVGLATSLAAVSFTNSIALAMTWLVFGISIAGGIYSGWMVNYIDIAPNYSGTLMGVGNTLKNLCVLAQPLIVSTIVTDVNNQHQWRIMLLSLAGFAFLCNPIFVMLMSAEVQPWNNVTPVSTVTHEEELRSLNG